MGYDVKGRKTSMADPDRGSWSWTYDILDEKTGQTDANGNATTITYDLLGRMTQRVEVGLTSNWTFDTQPMGIGKLASTTTAAGFSRTQTYDSLGRPSQTTDTIGGTAYLTTQYYDSYSRLSSVIYPSGWTAGYTYNAAGFMSSVTNGVGGAALWTANARDAMSTLTEETAGNGIVTNLTYDPHVERLTAISAGSSGAVQSDSYIWDTVGNLSQRVDSNNSVTEAFTYDALNRMVTADITGGASKSYAYDSTGNIICKSDLSSCSSSSPNYTYPTSGSGSVRPHAVSSITGTLNNGAGTGGVITNPIFSYDSNGNMLSETGTGSIGRTLTYTAFNVPATITNGTSTLAFTFDSRHKRIIQTAPEGTTVYLNGGGIKSEKFTATGTGVVTWRNYIVADGAIKVIYSQTGNTSGPNWGSSTWGSFTGTSSTTASTPLYLHQDHLGSVVAISGTSGSLIEQDAYDPWGKRRNLNGTDDTYDALTSDATRGYTGQEHLGDLAMIHMNARVYDPQIGKFYGTDPKGGDSGGSWNRYAYVMNNPLNSVDPTGMENEPPELCPDACGGGDSGDGGYGSDSGDGEYGGDNSGFSAPSSVRQVVRNPNGTIATQYDPNCDCFWDILVTGSPAFISTSNRSGISGGNGGGDNGGSQTPAAPPTGSKPQSDQNSHKYVINRPTACSASDAFNQLKEPGMSAPGAPAAQEGFTPQIVLFGNNPISQYVNSSTMTIVNTTLPGHQVYPGNVTIHVNPVPGGGSDINIVGTGTGNNPEFNVAVGIAFFGGVATEVMQNCNAAAGIPTPSF